MPHVITDACQKCGECAAVCPLEIITPGETKYVIDADQCVDCGQCSATCEHNAIEEE